MFLLKGDGETVNRPSRFGHGRHNCVTNAGLPQDLVTRLGHSQLLQVVLTVSKQIS